MTAPAKTRSSSKLHPAPPQFLIDANGNKTAVLLPLETWARVESFLQNDLERALVSEPVSESISLRLAKRLRERGQGIKGELLTPEAFQAEVERLRK
jgi:hypothetical protein